MTEKADRWSEPHAESERLAQAAAIALREGLSDRAKELFAEAAAQEVSALALLDDDAPRTYGIVAASAVALWVKAGRRAQAEEIAARATASRFLPAFAAEEIAAILRAPAQR